MVSAFDFGRFLGKHANAQPANSFRSDAHGSSFVPFVGGAISGAVKPHPGRSGVSNVLSEGAAGLGGGLSGAINGGALGTLLGLPISLATGRAGPVLGGAGIGAGIGSSLGTHLGAQSSRENVPLNARALEALKQQAAPAPQKAAAEKKSFTPMAMTGAGLGGIAGLATSGKNKKLKHTARGALLGGATGLGADVGGSLGLVGGGLTGGALGALLGALGNRLAAGSGSYRPNPDLPMGLGLAGAGVGALGGAGLGALMGGRYGYKKTRESLDAHDEE